MAGFATLFFVPRTPIKSSRHDDQPSRSRPGRRRPPDLRPGTERGGGAAPASDVSGVLALVKAGKFEEALGILRPLAQGRAVEANVLFLIGLAATGASQQPDLAGDEREALLDEAIASLRAMLVDRPDLVRVRLELARAFFENAGAIIPH